MPIYPPVEIFCDGACLGNPGPGGWAALLRFASKSGIVEKELTGSEGETTNNRMELLGAIRGLEALSVPCEVNLYCDSKYVVQGITSWMEGWKRSGWLKANRTPVMNVELWQTLDALCRRHRVKAHWVRGHAGHIENEKVDELARKAAEKIMVKINHNFA